MFVSEAQMAPSFKVNRYELSGGVFAMVHSFLVCWITGKSSVRNQSSKSE